MNGISCTTTMAYEKRNEQLPGCERIIGELRDLAYEHFVIDLEGYPDGLRFVQTTRKDGKYLIEGGDLSLYGLSNAVTRYSQDVESYDRATALEGLGWQIATMGKNKWKEINA